MKSETYYQRTYNVNGVKVVDPVAGLNSRGFTGLEIMKIALPILQQNPLTTLNVAVTKKDGQKNIWTYGGYKWNVMTAEEQQKYIYEQTDVRSKNSDLAMEEYNDFSISYKPLNHNIIAAVKNAKRL